jgi:hypothetical protein
MENSFVEVYSLAPLLVEGCMAIFVSLLFIALLPTSPANPNPLLFPKFSFFSEREREVLLARVHNDDAAKKNSAKKLELRKDIFGTLSNWRVWPHVLIAIALIAPTGAMGTYTPTLIKGFKFGSECHLQRRESSVLTLDLWPALQANALSSVAGWISLVVVFVFGYLSDKTNIRGPMVIMAITFFWVFWVAFQQKSVSPDRWLKYGLLVMVQGFNAAYHVSYLATVQEKWTLKSCRFQPLNATWLSLNCKTPQQRSVAMAMCRSRYAA